MATCIQPQTTPSCEICKLILNGDILEAKSTLSSLDKYEDVDGLSVFLLAKFYLNFLKEFSHSEGLGLSAAWTNEQVRKGEKRGEVFSLMKELLRHGVSSNTHHYGETPFLCAVSTHDTDFIRIILEHGADVNLKTLETKMNAIALTIILNDANILKLLFSFGAKVNGPCCQDLTPLQLSLNKSIEVSKVLLQNGADVQQVMQMQGREVLLTTPPLIHAVETDNLFLASILLEHGEDVNQGYGACSHSPIHFAIIRSNSDMVKLLIQYGANLNKRNGRGTTPLALVLSHCKGPMITTLTEALMSAGCSRTKGSPIAVFRKHYPPLHIAAFFGSDYHLEFIKKLIEMSDIVEMDRMNTLADNVQSCSLSYETDPIVGPSRQNLRRSLSCSERTSNLTIKEQQAFINTQAIDGSTALHMAVLGNNLAGAQFLISQGADPYISCQNGSLLHAAVMATQMGEELLKFVLKFNFDFNKKNDDGNTSLILASRKVTAGVCRLLIENGALLNVQDGRYGETALSTSVYFGFEDNAELLISHGAGADLPDHRDTNAMYWAIFNCREKALRLLLQAGARLTRAELSTYPKNIKEFLVGSCANNRCAPTQRCIPTVVVPTCEDLDCGRPPPPPKGYTRNIAGTSHGSLTTYTCSRYYIQANLSGPTIECLLNNSWSKPDYSNSLCRKPSSCEEVLQCQPAYTDGEYWLYPLHLQLVKDTKVKVYCHSMASGSPVEYITVDPTQNYGHNAGKDNGAEKVTAYFNKIRVNITNLQVIITDSTFASATYHYAAADDCRCNIGCPPRKGYFKVHTIGTGLKFGPLAAWYAHGWYPQIEHWYQSEDNTTFSANCGGYCGGCRPIDDTLPLIPNDQEVLPDNSAVVPSCA